jgi:tripartite-type tricarboxylate transporter receptor subunit TctC
VDKANAEVTKTFSAPEMLKRLEDQGFEPATNTPDEFGRMIRADLARWTTIIKDAGIKVESAR